MPNYIVVTKSENYNISFSSTPSPNDIVEFLKEKARLYHGVKGFASYHRRTGQYYMRFHGKDNFMHEERVSVFPIPKEIKLF